MNLSERDVNVVWHPFTHQKNMLPPIPIVKGAATLLFDEYGNEYIDAISSWWVTIHGHSNMYIAEKLFEQAKQLEQVIFAGFTHEPAVKLAERLLTILPNKFSKIFYSDNGSTAVEVALKMALQYWWNQSMVNAQSSIVQRKKILAFNNSYHGDTFGSMSVSDRSIFTMAFHDLLFEVIFIDTPTAENIETLKTVVAENATELAAFIYEPLVQGAGGMKMYNAGLMNELLSVIKHFDIICIADEVMTGFGRTGKLFASEYLQNKPDIICLSKGLTGGTMALGATACTQKIYDAFVNDDKLKTFFHGHSFTANPLACAVANASLDLLMKEDCLKKINWITEQNNNFFRQIANSKIATQKIKDLRTLGTILAFEIEVGEDGYLNNISAVITAFAMQKNIYIRPLGNTVYIMPPYCITTIELQNVYNLIEEIIEKYAG
jgi:adenosylmethionine-8-amino-7-oxononanoate aminotransferase